MKILFLTTAYPGLSPKGYGLGTAISHTASALAGKGHEVHVLCLTGHRRTSVRASVVCHEFALGDLRFGPRHPYGERAHQVFLNADAPLAELYQYWCEYAHLAAGGFVPDIIDAHDFKALGYFFVQHRRLGYPEAAAPILTSCHSNQFAMYEQDRDLAFSWPRMLLRQRQAYQLVGSDNRFAVSQFMADRISERFHLPRPPVYYTCSAHAVPENRLPPCDNDELLYFGQLSYLKGILTLLQTCAGLWDEGLSFVLKLQGASQWYPPRGTDMATHIRTEYGRYIRRGLLRILPHAEDFETVRNALAQSRAVVLPTLMESLSHTCIEAMSYGRPVIASDRGGHTELVEPGSSGFLYEDERGLAQALKRVLAASPAELAEWGDSANRRVCRLVSVKNALPVYERICRETVERSHSEGPGTFPASPFADRRRFAAVPAPPTESRGGETVAGLIHVVMPCFNHGRFLREALDSIRNSTYRPIRLTVVDDASTDPRSREEFAALQKETVSDKGWEVHWVREPRNQGPVAIRNRWGRSSDAEFLCFVDADDRVRPSYFEHAAAVLKRYANVGFVGGWVEAFGGKSFTWVITDVDLPMFLLRNQAMGPSLIRRRAWPGQTLPSVGEDYDAFMSMVEQGWLGVNLPETVYDYRIQRRSRYHSATGDGHRIALADIARRHGPLYHLFGEEIYAFLVQNYQYGARPWRSRLVDWKEARVCRLRSAVRFALAHPRRLWRLPLELARILRHEGAGR